MFGLQQTGGPEKKPKEETVFDLEKDLKNPEKEREVLLLLESRITKIRKMLTAGEEAENYRLLGEIFNGYVSLLKVISRITDQGVSAK